MWGPKQEKLPRDLLPCSSRNTKTGLACFLAVLLLAGEGTGISQCAVGPQETDRPATSVDLDPPQYLRTDSVWNTSR